MKTRKKLFKNVALLILLHCIILLPSFAQEASDTIVFRSDVERQFVEAMHAFQAGQYDTAAQLFIKNLKEYPRSHRSTGAYIMGAKSLFEIHSYKESIKMLKDLIDLYPTSAYVDDAHYTLGLVYYQLNRYEDAATEWVTARDKSKDKKLSERTDKLLERITANDLSLAELQLLLGETNSDITRSLISIRIAEKMYKSGDVTAAEQILQAVTALSPEIKYVGEAILKLEQMRKRGVIKIGVVLPLMLKSELPATRELGVEFLEGMQYATDEYNQTAITKVNLEIRDTDRDPSVAARQVAELCTDPKISGIVGPIISSEVLASVGIANERGVPLITPTATANGITSLGEFLFQANPDYETRGRIAATYAFTELKAKTVVVLAPSDAIGRQLAQAFVREVTERNGDLLDVEWYQPGSTDIRHEIERIRHLALERLETTYVDFAGKLKQTEINKILMAGVSQHILDSLLEHRLTAPVDFLFGANGKKISDSLQIPTQLTQIKFDSLGIAVNNIDAIFVPIASSDEIPIVSAQLKFYNVQAQVLGTGDWNDLNELDQQRQYTDGIIFFVDSYFDPLSQEYQVFLSKYQKAMKGKVPNTNVLIGYDVMRMVLEAVSRGSTRRTELAAALAKMDYTGWHSKIMFSKLRVNSSMSVMQYKSRTIKKIGVINLSQ